MDAALDDRVALTAQIAESGNALPAEPHGGGGQLRPVPGFQVDAAGDQDQSQRKQCTSGGEHDCVFVWT